MFWAKASEYENWTYAISVASHNGLQFTDEETKA